MTNEDIKKIALANGFILKSKADGEEAADLHPYVYSFARELIAAAPTPPAQEVEPVALIEFKEKIDQWAQAYPLDIFPEPDFKRANEALKAKGMNVDLIAASSARHAITRVKKMLDGVTAHPQSDELRKAAEDALFMLNVWVDNGHVQLASSETRIRDNLRIALEKGKK